MVVAEHYNRRTQRIIRARIRIRARAGAGAGAGARARIKAINAISGSTHLSIDNKSYITLDRVTVTY